MDENLDRAREPLTELFFEPDILRALLFDTTDNIRRLIWPSIATATTFNLDTPIDDHYPAIVVVTVRLEYAACS